MIQRGFVQLALSAALFFIQAATAQDSFTPANMSSKVQPRTDLGGDQETRTKSNIESKNKTEKKSRTSLVTPGPVRMPQLVPQTLTYFHPGILVYQDEEWQGSDHLLNLTNNIGVYVTILKPEGETLDISEAQVKKMVEEIFVGAKINPKTLNYKDQPPLPAFEVEILIYPVEKGYVACCDGRLFESVTLSRFVLDEGMAFQAITWEKRTLIVGPKNKFLEQLTTNIHEIVGAFADRYKAYVKLKRSAE